MEGFEDFITNLLRRGRINEEHIAMFLTPENIATARIAFTHSSFDAEQNNEMYEFFGDPVINEFVPWYIHLRFPKIKSVNIDTAKAVRADNKKSNVS